VRINYLYFELYLFVVPLFQIHKQIIITDLSQLKPSLVRSLPQTQGPYIVIHVFRERTLIPKMDATSAKRKNPEFRTRTKSSLRTQTWVIFKHSYPPLSCWQTFGTIKIRMIFITYLVDLLKPI